MHTHDWNDWRYFLAILRHGGLAAAARAMGVNHTTVLRRLNAMEQRLGVRLFERLSTGYQPTAAGEALSGYAERAEREVNEGELHLAGRDLRPSGTIRVTTTEDLVVGLLQPHFAAFGTAYPEIQLEVVSGNLLFDMTRREADIAIRPTARPPEHLVGRDLGRIGWAVYGSKRYLHRHGVPATAAELAGHRIVTADESLAGIGAAHWMRRHGSEQRVALRSGSLLIQLGAVREGMGLALLPCFLGDREPRVQRVLGPLADVATDGCWLLTHPSLRHVARIGAFMQFIAAALEPERARLAGSADPPIGGV